MTSLWKKLKQRVLGEDYDLSVFFLPENEMRRLNKTYRGKDYPANVLSFPFSKNAGEILINDFYKRKPKPAAYLFIHSLLHLKGFRHGEKMSKEEIGILKELYPNDWQKIMETVFRLIHSF